VTVRLRSALLAGIALAATALLSFICGNYLRQSRSVAVGLSPDVVHVGGAMTYTLVLMLAALVAMGQPAGRGLRDGIGTERVVRALITAGIMLAPAPSIRNNVLTVPDSGWGSPGSGTRRPA
jgi:hypothetical protein